jgi:hypothetical protein
MSNLDRHPPPSVEQFCGEHFPDHFTGVAVRQQTLLVYRRPHPDFDRRVRAAFPQPGIRFVDTDLSLRELTAVLDRVRADHQEWLDRGIHITGFGVGVDRVEVSVRPADLADARPALAQRYGAAVIVSGSEPMLI